VGRSRRARSEREYEALNDRTVSGCVARQVRLAHALLEACERADHEDWQLSIVPGRHAVQQVFEITGTIEQLPFTPSTNGAGDSDPRDSQLPRRPYDVALASRAQSRHHASPALHTNPGAR
jgi:hypothetical protein